MTGRTFIFTVAGLAVLTLTLSAQVNERPEVQLQAAIKQELVDGDLKAAIEQYKVLASNKDNPAVAARALVRLAACYDKLGQVDARATYERVVREYPSQTDAVAEARAWLSAHGGTTTQRASRSTELVWTGRDLYPIGGPTPDGRYIPFADNRDRSGNLAVLDLKTNEIRVLTKDATGVATAENAVSSPDGRQLAYRLGEGKESTIRLINTDGTNMRILLRDTHNNYLGAWSPDGKHLAAAHHTDTSDAVVLISTADGSITQLITPPTSPDIGGFCGDGRFLVYARNADKTTGPGGVYALAVNGSQAEPLVEGAARFSSPSWSPDSQRVFFTSDRSGSLDLWAIRVTNGRQQGAPELVQSNVSGMVPGGFTKDGSFYYGMENTQLEAYSAELDPETLKASKPQPISERSVGNNLAPELSPDGASVAYVRRRAGEQLDVVVSSLSTREERTLATLDKGAYGARSLQWFPDGRSLLVTDATGDRKRFRQIDVRSGDSRVLFEGQWGVWIGALSADGKSLFYSSFRDGTGGEGTIRLVKRHLATGDEAELYRRENPEGNPGMGVGLFGLTASPDGTRLAFAVNTPERVLMTVATDGGPAREIRWSGGHVSMTPQSAMAWTRDSRHLVFTGRCGSGDDLQLCAIPVEGGDLKPLGLSMQRIDSRMISADGRRIAYTGATIRREIFVIRNLLSAPVAPR